MTEPRSGRRKKPTPSKKNVAQPSLSAVRKAKELRCIVTVIVTAPFNYALR